MKEINLDSEIKEIFAYHKFSDKYDLNIRQFDYYDMLDFAKKISEKTVELCAENATVKQVNDLYHVVDNDSILNTKSQIK